MYDFPFFLIGICRLDASAGASVTSRDYKAFLAYFELHSFLSIAPVSTEEPGHKSTDELPLRFNGEASPQVERLDHCFLVRGASEWVKEVDSRKKLKLHSASSALDL